MNYINHAAAVPSAQGVSRRSLKIYKQPKRDTKSGLANA